MARFPLFGISQEGKSVTVTAQRRLNLYAEINNPEDKSPISFYPAPGLTLFADAGQPVRGWRVVLGRWFVVAGSGFYELSNVGVFTLRGNLSTSSGPVDLSDNGLQVIIVDGAGYSFVLATNTFATIADPDFPGATTVTFDSGFNIVNKPNTGQFWISNSYDVTNWVATNFATAEANPDSLVRVFTDQGQLILFGDVSTEFWINAGATDFPYQRIGSAVVEWGLVARFSVAKFNRSIICLMRNLLGQQQVVTLNGYLPTPISTPEVDYAISQYSTVTDATAFSYNLGGHAFYEINFPTAAKTWLYDGLTQLWSELESSGARHRANFGIQYTGKTYVSDWSNGSIYLLDTTVYTDNGSEIAREIIGRHVYAEEEKPLGTIQIEFQPGVGTVSGQGSNPMASLQISRDGGFTYGPEKFAGIGKIGEYLARARWLRNGRAKDFVYKIRITDPAYPVITGAWLDEAA